MNELKETRENTNMDASSIPPAIQGGGAVSIAVTLVAALLWLRRKLSTDNLGVSKDSAESHLMKTLAAERDKAMAAAEEAWSMRTKDAVLIGELTGKVNHLLEVNESLRQEISTVRDEIKDLRTLIKTLLPAKVGDALLQGALTAKDVTNHLEKN